MVDYNSRSIQFYSNNEFITLKREIFTGPLQASIHQLHRLSIGRSIAKCYALTEVLTNTKLDFNLIIIESLIILCINIHRN